MLYQAFLQKTESWSDDGIKLSSYIFYFKHPEICFTKVLSLLPEELYFRFYSVGIEDEAGVYASLAIDRFIRGNNTRLPILTELLDMKFKPSQLLAKTEELVKPITYHLAGVSDPIFFLNQHQGMPDYVMFQCPDYLMHAIMIQAKKTIPKMTESFSFCLDRLDEFLIIDNEKILSSFPDVKEIFSFLDYGLGERIDKLNAF